MSYLVNPYMVTAGEATVTWEDDFTSDNWSSDSGSNYIDTTNNKLIRGANDPIWIQLPFTPEVTSTGKFVVTYGWQIVTTGWASQSQFMLSTESNLKFNTLSDDNEMVGLIGNDWEASGGMMLTIRAKYSGSLVVTNATPPTSGIPALDVITYCKTVWDGTASDKLKTYFYSDADMTTPVTIGSNSYRNVTSLPSNWDDTESTWYLSCSGYAGYSSTNNITPIKFYNGVNDI